MNLINRMMIESNSCFHLRCGGCDLRGLRIKLLQRHLLTVVTEKLCTGANEHELNIDPPDRQTSRMLGK